MKTFEEWEIDRGKAGHFFTDEGRGLARLAYEAGQRIRDDMNGLLREPPELPSHHKFLDLIEDLSEMAQASERQARRLFKLTERVGVLYRQIYPEADKAATR